MTFDEANDQLEKLESHLDWIYGWRMEVFHSTANKDSSWSSGINSEYIWHRYLEKEVLLYNMHSDTLKIGREQWRSKGLKYLLEMLEVYGGILPKAERRKEWELEGPIKIRVPYKMKDLSPLERKWAKNDPPPFEQLSQIMGYDENFKRLFYLRGKAPAAYEDILSDDSVAVSAPKYFIPINGYMIPRWKCISVLLFGNPYGIEDLERAKQELSQIPVGCKTTDQILEEMHAETKRLMNIRLPHYREKRLPEDKMLSRKWYELQQTRKKIKQIEKQIEEENEKYREKVEALSSSVKNNRAIEKQIEQSSAAKLKRKIDRLHRKWNIPQ